MRIKILPSDEVFLGLAVGCTVFLIELGILALSLD